MFAQKLKAMLVVSGLVAAAVLATGLVVAADPPAKPVDRPKLAAAPADPPKPNPAPAVKPDDPKPLPKGPNKLLFYRAGHLTLIDPDGKNEKKATEDRAKFLPSGPAALSPDGTGYATLIHTPGDRAPTGRPVMKLYTRKLDEKEPGTDLGVECQMFHWSPDGAQLLCETFEDGPPDKVKLAVEHFLIDVKTKEKTRVKLPEDHIVSDWARDGRYFLTTRISKDTDGPAGRIYLMNRDGTEHKAVTDGKRHASFGKLSPDGKRVLYMEIEAPKDKPRQFRKLWVADVTSETATAVADVPLNAELQGFCWSPDGKRIAYTWREVHEGKPEDLLDKETESFLVVCDPDGKNAKTIATEKAPGLGIITIGQVDWR